MALARASAVRSAQRPERQDQAGRLGERDEGGGRQLAAQRVAPAEQRLDAADPAVAQVDVGLVDEVHLAVVDGVGEVELEPALLERQRLLRRARAATKRARPSILARRSAVSACISSSEVGSSSAGGRDDADARLHHDGAAVEHRAAG